MSYSQHPQARYGTCDTFFIQTDDDAFTIADRNRERARAIARIQHRELGSKLSQLVADEYQDDILDHMEFMEVRILNYLKFFLSKLTLVDRDAPRRQLHRHPDRNPMVHASLLA
jgi:hypothetical protein